MYELIYRLNRDERITIIMISHDISSALKYATHILRVGDRFFFGTQEQYISECVDGFTRARQYSSNDRRWEI